MKILLKKLLIDNPTVVYGDEVILDVLDQKMGEFNHLPVIDRDGKYLGVISKSIIYPHVRLGHGDKQVSEVVAPLNPICLVNRGVSLLEDLLGVLRVSKFLFVPVTSDDGKLAGIIPNRVVLDLFAKAIGMDEEGEVIEVTASDISGNLNKMLKVFEDYQANIISINVLNLDVFNLRKIYIKYKGDKGVGDRILGVLESYGFKTF